MANNPISKHLKKAPSYAGNIKAGNYDTAGLNALEGGYGQANAGIQQALGTLKNYGRSQAADINQRTAEGVSQVLIST